MFLACQVGIWCWVQVVEILKEKDDDQLYQNAQRIKDKRPSKTTVLFIAIRSVYQKNGLYCLDIQWNTVFIIRIVSILLRHDKRILLGKLGMMVEDGVLKSSFCYVRPRVMKFILVVRQKMEVVIFGIPTWRRQVVC